MQDTVCRVEKGRGICVPLVWLCQHLLDINGPNRRGRGNRGGTKSRAELGADLEEESGSELRENLKQNKKKS